MNETVLTILKRRSVRKYLSNPVSDEDLSCILRCGQAAPSGMNRQACQLTVLGGEPLLGLLAAVRADALRSPDPFWKNAAKDSAFNFYYDAPVLITVSAEPLRNPSTPVEDGSVALENMMLAASSLGLASCWIHALVMINPLKAAREYLGQCGLPLGHRIIGSMSLGYAAGDLPERPPLDGNRIVIAK